MIYLSAPREILVSSANHVDLTQSCHENHYQITIKLRMTKDPTVYIELCRIVTSTDTII